MPRLRLVSPERLTIRRRRAGRGFTYCDARGRRIADPAALARIRALAIPPAWSEVRIAADPRAHLQAVGRDAAGRLQYRYHPEWTEVRERHKTVRLGRILEALPKVRAAVERDLGHGGTGRAVALACAVALIDESHIRAGHDGYARRSGGRGTATLLKGDARIGRERVTLSFAGKGGKRLSGEVRDRRLAAALARLAALKGRRLLQWRETAGRPKPIRAAEINAYLRTIAGTGLSAKDFRMLGANVMAAERLAAEPPGPSAAARKRQFDAALGAVAERLGNTPAVARKSYVQACVRSAFEAGDLAEAVRRARSGNHRSRIENALRRILAALGDDPA